MLLKLARADYITWNSCMCYLVIWITRFLIFKKHLLKGNYFNLVFANFKPTVAQQHSSICILMASPNYFLEIHYNFNFTEYMYYWMYVALSSDCECLKVGTISHLKYQCLTQ